MRFSLSKPRSECGTYKTVKARFWPWLSGSSPKMFYVVPFRSAAVTSVCEYIHVHTYYETYTCMPTHAYIYYNIRIHVHIYCNIRIHTYINYDVRYTDLLGVGGVGVALLLVEVALSTFLSPANMAHVRQPRPDSGLDCLD